MIKKLADLFSGMSIECRHGVYVWWLTIANLSGILLIALFKEGEVAAHAVDSLASIETILVGSYLGLETITRSQVLNKIAERMGGTRPADPVPPTQGT